MTCKLFKTARGFTRCDSSIPVNRELHNYWDQHSAENFDQKSASGGRLEPLRWIFLGDGGKLETRLVDVKSVDNLTSDEIYEALLHF